MQITRKLAKVCDNRNVPLHPPTMSPSEALAQVGDRALERASGAPASDGNAVDLLLDAEQNFPAWLVEIRGPAVAELERAFAQSWDACGTPLPLDAFTPESAIEPQGHTRLRVIAGVPTASATFRMDLVVASIARKSLWLTDAYFVATSAYVQALRAAARDGVDVRLLVPGVSDIPALSPLSRAQYRPLLESGVRVFEWDGTMLHAKTAVPDKLWARVGSTNLNLASWMTNYDMDVALEDPLFAEKMARQFERDLTNTTEIVLTRRNRVRPAFEADGAPPRDGDLRPPARRSLSGSANRAAASAVSV